MCYFLKVPGRNLSGLTIIIIQPPTTNSCSLLYEHTTNLKLSLLIIIHLRIPYAIHVDVKQRILSRGL